MKDRVLRLRTQIFISGNHFENAQSLSRPPVRACDLLQFLSGLRQGHINNLFSLPDPSQQKLKSQGCLTGARVALDEIEVPLWQPTAKHVVKSGDAGQDAARALAGSDCRLVRSGSVPLVSVHSSPQTRMNYPRLFDPNLFAGVAPVFFAVRRQIRAWVTLKNGFA